jgi:hypothetical protein
MPDTLWCTWPWYVGPVKLNPDPYFIVTWLDGELRVNGELVWPYAGPPPPLVPRCITTDNFQAMKALDAQACEAAAALHGKEARYAAMKAVYDASPLVQGTSFFRGELVVLYKNGIAESKEQCPEGGTGRRRVPVDPYSGALLLYRTIVSTAALDQFLVIIRDGETETTPDASEALGQVESMRRTGNLDVPGPISRSGLHAISGR